MGYECHFKFYEKVEGEYNKEEDKILKKKVGDPFEDVSLERLAGAVMAQMARRDIWIVDVEIFELTKKPVSFKETKGGIVLKNKKFLFDGGTDTSMIKVEEMMETVMPVQQMPQRQLSVQAPQDGSQQRMQPHEAMNPRRPIEWVIFTPELHQVAEIKSKGLAFTIEKKYPIFEKQQGAVGEIYLTVDDRGREQTISDKYFVPVPVLFADRELGFSAPKTTDNLSWGNASRDPGMPQIRR